MISPIAQHFSLNRKLLRAIGLWPYEQSRFTRFQFIFLLGTLVSNIIFQLMTILMSTWTMEFIIKILSFALFLISCATHYNSFYVNSDVVMDLLEQSQDVWKKLKDNNEIAIIERYGNNGKRFTIIFSIISMCGVIFLIFLPFWPRILDVVSSLNESRSYGPMPIEIEYFVEQQSYFYLIILYTNATIFIAILSLLATGTMFIAWNRYTCGLFRIASYRIENALRTNETPNGDRKDKNFIYTSLIYAIDAHRRATRFAKLQETGFRLTFMCLLLTVVTSLSLNLFQIFQAISYGYNIDEIAMSVIYLYIHYIYMFLVNYFAQAITDHDKHVFSTAYNVPWYVAPLSVQRLILFLLQKGTRPLLLNISGLFAASLEGFALLTKASVSYFTVLYSMR